MKKNATKEQIVKRLQAVFNSAELTAEYMKIYESWQVNCGWCGTLSPLSRAAFVKAFGLEVVEEAEAEAKQLNSAALSNYRKSYEKWAHLMQPVAPYVEAIKGTEKYSPEREAAERKLHSVCRANILTMCRAAFPGVKFTLKQSNQTVMERIYSGRYSWDVAYIDGPTLEQFRRAVDLHLFSVLMPGKSHEFKPLEFQEFARRYMKESHTYQISISRKVSEKTGNELEAKIMKEIPGFAPSEFSTCLEIDAAKITDEQLKKIGCNVEAWHKSGLDGSEHLWVSELADFIFNTTDYTATQKA